MAKNLKNSLKNGDSNNVTESKEPSNQSAVFKTLFGLGETPEQNSIFSENNPFRRKLLENRPKNQELGLGFAAAKDTEREVNVVSDFSEVEQQRIRKKEKSKKESRELVEEKVKKSRKVAFKGNEENFNDSENVGNEPKESLEKDASDVPGNGGSVEGEKKKKKKRKKDEVEVEYEARLYGAADETKEDDKREISVLGEKRKKMDNPEDVMVTKEGFDDESKLLRTVFVGNIPLKLKKKEIVKEFGKFGEVESVRIRSVPIVDGKIPRKGAVIKKQINENGDSVHAYIVFKTEESAQESLAHNMAVVGGNHIRVDRACPPRKKLKGDDSPLFDNKRTVFVGNLPFDVKDEEIYKLFCGIKTLETSVEGVRVIRDPGSSLGKGIAYVLFKTTDAANSTVKKRNLRLRNRELRLSHAKSTDTPLKRKSTSQAETNNSYAAKKSAVAPRTPDSGNTNYRFKDVSNLSYQGLRASKSGAQKKVNTKVTFPVKSKSQPKFQPVTEKSTGKKKRPAVAARKEKALKAANAPQLAGKKRKTESGGQKKKARKFR